MVILKGCAIYCVNKNGFEIYCAVLEILSSLWAAL
jgi:hypothetical protein